MRAGQVEGEAAAELVEAEQPEGSGEEDEEDASEGERREGVCVGIGAVVGANEVQQGGRGGCGV